MQWGAGRDSLFTVVSICHVVFVQFSAVCSRFEATCISSCEISKKMLKDESVGTLSFSDDLSEATNDNCMLDSRRKEDELDLSALYRLLEMWVSVSRLTVTLYHFSAQCVLLC